MGKPPMKRGGKGKDAGRRVKKKVSVLNTEKVEYIDWKDVNLLRRFMSDRAKIRSRRVTGNDVQQQRAVAMAIKNAREMALLPYASRVTTQRGARGRDRDRDGDRRSERSEAPAEFEQVEDAVVEGAEGAPVEAVDVPEVTTEVEETVAEAVAE